MFGRKRKIPEKLIRDLRYELSKHKHESQFFERRLDILSKNINRLTNTGFKILGVEKDKQGEFVIIYKANSPNDWAIMLKDLYSVSADNNLVIFCTNNRDGIPKDVIRIDDIQGVENRGYGSICMKYLQALAEKDDIKYMEGRIAKVDWGHVDRLEYFYKKHGFDVKLYPNHKEGRIKWTRLT